MTQGIRDRRAEVPKLPAVIIWTETSTVRHKTLHNLPRVDGARSAILRLARRVQTGELTKGRRASSKQQVRQQQVSDTQTTVTPVDHCQRSG